MGNLTYTLEQKQEAAAMYAVLGSYTKVAKRLDMPKATVHYWSTNWEGGMY